MRSAHLSPCRDGSGNYACPFREKPDFAAALARHDHGMTLPTSFSLAPVAAVIASFLMVLAGVGQKRLRWRTVQCRVCDRPRDSCTCRWR